MQLILDRRSIIRRLRKILLVGVLAGISANIALAVLTFRKSDPELLVFATMLSIQFIDRNNFDEFPLYRKDGRWLLAGEPVSDLGRFVMPAPRPGFDQHGYGRFITVAIDEQIDFQTFLAASKSLSEKGICRVVISQRGNATLENPISAPGLIILTYRDRTGKIRNCVDKFNPPWQ